MKISPNDVQRIADLAKLELTPEEKPRMAEQLARIIGYMDKLNQLDTENVQPTSHVLPMRNVFREDKVSRIFSSTSTMACAPKTDMGHYQVPKIIGG